jgi:hypothetical protein
MLVGEWKGRFPKLIERGNALGGQVDSDDPPIFAFALEPLNQPFPLKTTHCCCEGMDGPI